MATSSSIVIKVKYGEAFRRFKASIFDNKLLVDITMLKEKIRSFFSFGSGAEFTMTYVDEDGDVVIIADDDDLHDIVGQALNPLRITVKLNNGNPAGSTGTFAPVSLSQSQLPHHPFNSEVSQLPLYQPQLQTWNPAASETPKSPLLKPSCWNHVVPKTSTSPLIQIQSQPLNPTVLTTPSWPLVQPGCLQFNPAVPKPQMSPPQPRFEPWTPVFSKTLMSWIIKPKLQTRSPVESESIMSQQLIKSPSQTLNIGATPMAPGVTELVEKETTGLNQFPASMSGKSLPQTGDTFNVMGHQDVNSESSTIKNTKVPVNSDIGNFNMMDKQPPKVTEDVKSNEVQPLRFVDYKFPDIQFQSVKAPSKASNRYKGSTVKNKQTTGGVKDSKKTEVNHEVRSLFTCNDHRYVRCNSCGIYPTAPWFKSKVKENYDLCCTCFAKLQGSFADYIRMDKSTITNWKNFGETLVKSFTPPVVKNPEVANQDHLLDAVLPGKNIIKVSDSEGSNVDSPHKDQEKIAIKDLTVDKGDVSSTMATTLTGPARPEELESTMDSPPVEFGTTSLDPNSFHMVPPMVSGASSSTVAVGQSSAIATQNGSDEWEEALVTELEYKEFKQQDDKQILSVNDFDFEKTLDELYSVSEWDPILDELQKWVSGGF